MDPGKKPARETPLRKSALPAEVAGGSNPETEVGTQPGNDSPLG